MLIGIVVTNAIVLLDLVERLRADGHSTRDALIEGGRTRIRPILMTAIATMLALVPLAAGFNEGSIIAAELGTVVIGGLLSSTFLTLLVVPVVYSLVDGLTSRLVGGRASRTGSSQHYPGRPRSPSAPTTPPRSRSPRRLSHSESGMPSRATSTRCSCCSARSRCWWAPSGSPTSRWSR